MNRRKMNLYCPCGGARASRKCPRCGRLFCSLHWGDGHRCYPSNHEMSIRLVEAEGTTAVLFERVLMFKKSLLWACGVAAVLLAVLFWLQLSG